MAIYVDFDGVLAHYDGWHGPEHLGEPIPGMIIKVRKLLASGKEVKVFTARVCVMDGVSDTSNARATQEFADHQRKLIQKWCTEHIGALLPVTAMKGFDAEEFWDDRAREVAPNTGEFVTEAYIETALENGVLRARLAEAERLLREVQR